MHFILCIDYVCHFLRKIIAFSYVLLCVAFVHCDLVFTLIRIFRYQPEMKR